MKLSILFTFFAIALLSACTNLFKKPDSNEYAEMCWNAEHNRRIAEAERECYFALVNADWTNNPKLKSQRLYNLGKIKQQLSKFPEAESLFKESLQIEESFSSPPRVIGLRLIALSVSLAGQYKWSEGAQLLERILPIAPQFSKQERIEITQILIQYSQHLKTMNQTPLAKRFEKTLRILRGGAEFSDSLISGSLAQPKPCKSRQIEEQAHEKDEKESRTGF